MHRHKARPKYESLGKRGPKYALDDNYLQDEDMKNIQIPSNTINTTIESNDLGTKTIFDREKTTSNENTIIKTIFNNEDKMMTFDALQCRRKCKNGGVCVGNNKCSCPPDWRGRSCNKRKYFIFQSCMDSKSMKNIIKI